MTRRERHLVEIGDVPGADDQATGIGIAPDFLEDPADLIDVLPIWSGPRTPLISIDGTELASRIGPFVPDGDVVLMQPSDVGLAAKEPQQFINNRAQVKLLGCQQRKSVAQIET